MRAALFYSSISDSLRMYLFGYFNCSAIGTSSGPWLMLGACETVKAMDLERFLKIESRSFDGVIVEAVSLWD